jgi:DNA-binding MarR family transcriptional regulator
VTREEDVLDGCKIHNIADAALWKGPPIDDATDLLIALALHRKHLKSKTANITTIAALTGISRATVARRIGRLEKSGFAELRSSGKSSIIVLTDRGIAHMENLIVRIQCRTPNV